VEDHLFRRLFRLNSDLNPKVRILALPVEIGPSNPAASFRPEASRGGRALRPDHPLVM